MWKALFTLRTCVIALHLAVFGILLARRPEAIFNAQFWAEDGAIFFADQMRVGFWHAVVVPYSGYLHVVPRILAALLSGFRIYRLPTAYGVLSVPIAALCCCAFAWPRFRVLVSSDALRFVCCLVMASALPAGGELIGSITNLQWFLAPVAILIAFSGEPDSKGRVMPMAALILMALIGLSTPALFVVLPLFLWQIAMKRGWVRWNSLAVVLALGVEVFEVIHTHAGGSKPHWKFSTILISTVVAGISKCILTPMLGAPILAQNSTRAMVAMLLLVLLIALPLLVVFVMTLPDWRRRLMLLSATYIGAASLAAVLGGRNLADSYLVPMDLAHLQGERYFFLGSCLVLFIAAFAADFVMSRMSHPLLKAAPVAVLVMAYSYGAMQNFATPPMVDLYWPSYASEIEKWNELQRRKQVVGGLDVPLNPPPFHMTLEPKVSE